MCVTGENQRDYKTILGGMIDHSLSGHQTVAASLRRMYARSSMWAPRPPHLARHKPALRLPGDARPLAVRDGGQRGHRPQRPPILHRHVPPCSGRHRELLRDLGALAGSAARSIRAGTGVAIHAGTSISTSRHMGWHERVHFRRDWHRNYFSGGFGGSTFVSLGLGIDIGTGRVIYSFGVSMSKKGSFRTGLGVGIGISMSTGDSGNFVACPLSRAVVSYAIAPQFNHDPGTSRVYLVDALALRVRMRG